MFLERECGQRVKAQASRRGSVVPLLASAPISSVGTAYTPAWASFPVEEEDGRALVGFGGKKNSAMAGRQLAG